MVSLFFENLLVISFFEMVAADESLFHNRWLPFITSATITEVLQNPFAPSFRAPSFDYMSTSILVGARPRDHLKWKKAKTDH